jgi:uncharacterized protein YfaS (alpha-2-macroglobulin family)
MNTRWLAWVPALVLWAVTYAGPDQQPGRIQGFSPQGTVKKVRQVRVQFSESMVSFGDPRAAEDPFEILCSEKGTGRWADPFNWIYDFDRDLPAGVRCSFNLKPNFRTLRGSEISGQRRFQFSTGGPSILASNPFQGSEHVSEDQVFVVELDGNATEASVLSAVSFSVEGISERVGARIISGREKEAILEAAYPSRFRKRPQYLLLLQAKQRFPAGSKVNLIWGSGVYSPSGIATERDQVLQFKTRIPFTATFHCQRENPEAQCVPVGDMRLSFSAQVPWETVKKAVLSGPAGKIWRARSYHAEGDEEGVWEIRFERPFPENSTFTLELPAGIEDDSGRKLSNADSFPLSVRTDEYPPLAKFAADFGILELNAKTALPVTLRNVEPEIAARSFHVEGGEENFDPLPARPEHEELNTHLNGKILRIPSDKADQMVAWINKVSNRRWKDRDKSVFGAVTRPKTRSFSIPKLRGSRSFEVVGIPLKEPGFYVVEIESEILGASLLGISRPMFVPTTVLATNLSVHLKWGAESSLIWVTTLDKAKPMKQASLQVRNCDGKVLWQGATDANGIGRTGPLPAEADLPYCSYEALGRGLLVTAQSGGDMSFVHSNWDDGIESWRFRLPTEWQPTFQAAHTVLDRSLFRAGETVHMKHLLRRQALAGLEIRPAMPPPGNLVLQHLGSDQRYELPVKWDAKGIAETTWDIPREAKLGLYQIYLQPKTGEDGKRQPEFSGHAESMQHTGSFRVEEFRVPLMRAVIRPPSAPPIGPSSVPLDFTVSFLSGGGAGSLPVRFHHEIKPRHVGAFPGFENYTFSNGRVREEIVRGEPETAEVEGYGLKSLELTLDKGGSARTSITDLPPITGPMQILAELEFRDPNGEVQTSSSVIPLWPASRVVGIQPDSWMQSRDSLQFKVAVLDLAGKPVADAPVKVDLFQRKTYSHRKRLVGGFYAYEHVTETRLAGPLCEGKTDRRGLLLCVNPAPLSGEAIIQASTRDENGRETSANRSIWIAGGDEWWFAARDDDRMDLLPEKTQYEPGQKARLQVRMPFRKATALVSIEREGVGEAFVKELSGKEPVIEIPVKGSYAPNVFVSVLAVRGRTGDGQPTATVDLGRPAYKLGIAEINVGWRTHELKVKVSTDRPLYKVRDTAKVQISVTTPEGAPPPKGTEIALAAVDEGLLELMPNESWNLLDAMMGRRSYHVRNSTAQMHVIGKRHFGLKALPQGGGGGSQRTRELFDTLLLWKGRIPLSEQGIAAAEVPLNDSITSFRIVAVAAGADRFGTGSTSIRSTRDLVLLSGIAPVVRHGDRYRSTFTLRNTTERTMEAQVSASVSALPSALAPQTVKLGPGESKEIAWELIAPSTSDSLEYLIEANAEDRIRDRLSVTQKVLPAVPVRTFQETLTQLTDDESFEVERPKDAIPELGGIEVSLKPTLVDGMIGVRDYMGKYPYTCFEQNASKAVALRDRGLWQKIVAAMPAYMDSEGLLKYFSSMRVGSEVLTAYVLSIAQDAGYPIPREVQEKLVGGLRNFVEGRLIRHSSLPTADLSIRKLAAVAALSRCGQADASLLASISIEPNLWPTSAEIDWLDILRRVPSIPNRDSRIREAEQILRTRLNFQGTTMNFSTERADRLWWLMTSPDANAVRLVLSLLDVSDWKPDIPRMVRGALARQLRGHWDTTVANAWGVLAMESFSKAFEKATVSGTSIAALGSRSQSLDWSAFPGGKTLSFPWPPGRTTLAIRFAGTGRPWAAVRSNAAVPLKEPLSSGYKIKKTLIALEKKERGTWSRGDIVRVRLEVESQSDRTWVVLSDPIPAGAAILGIGLGRDSRMATSGEKQEGWAWPAFEERSFEAFRAYYEFVPKGSWAIEYTLRFNNEGILNLPPTRVEAIYSPEMFGELLNEVIRIK